VTGRTWHRWQALLLIPQPPLSLAYLLAMRARWLPPSYAPVFALALLPLLSMLAGLAGLRSGQPRVGRAALFTLAVVETAWAALTIAIVGFARVWHLSG
jgi:hypothetical protein